MIEDELSATRPDQIPLRRKCLFLFEGLDAAKKHWSKMKDGKLYKVKVEPLDIFHRGDMALIDCMKALAEAELDWQEAATMYWTGETSTMPEIEVMVQSAVVVEIISESDEERLNHLRRRWGLPIE